MGFIELAQNFTYPGFIVANVIGLCHAVRNCRAGIILTCSFVGAGQITHILCDMIEFVDEGINRLHRENLAILIERIDRRIRRSRLTQEGRMIVDLWRPRIRVDVIEPVEDDLARIRVREIASQTGIARTQSEVGCRVHQDVLRIAITDVDFAMLGDAVFDHGTALVRIPNHFEFGTNFSFLFWCEVFKCDLVANTAEAGIYRLCS